MYVWHLTLERMGNLKSFFGLVIVNFRESDIWKWIYDGNYQFLNMIVGVNEWLAGDFRREDGRKRLRLTPRQKNGQRLYVSTLETGQISLNRNKGYRGATSGTAFINHDTAEWFILRQLSAIDWQSSPLDIIINYVRQFFSYDFVLLF